MRSSRFGADPRGVDPLWPGPHGFAHRGLHAGDPFVENSLGAFMAALERGAGIECDLRLTADNEVVVFHDADAMRLCDNPLVIGLSTLSQVRKLSVGGNPPPTLIELLDLVAGRVSLLLEVKAESDHWRFGPALVKVLANYGGPFGIMSFDPRIARWLKTNASNLRRGLVVRDSLPPHKRWFAMAIADPQFLAVDVAALGKPWVAKARGRMPVYSWTVRTPDQRRLAATYADAPIWEADGRP
jgi:glycerophosphoryl diester phosphodiesterase